MPKTELLEACVKAGVAYKKSWNKDKLLQALLNASPDYLELLIADSQVVALNPAYADCLQALSTRAQQLEQVFKVMCFI